MPTLSCRVRNDQDAALEAIAAKELSDMRAARLCYRRHITEEDLVESQRLGAARRRRRLLYWAIALCLTAAAVAGWIR